MKILYLEHYAGSPRHGMEFRPYYLAREWVREGHEVTIAAASFSHVRSRQPEASSPLTTENIDGIRYLWVRAPAYEGNGLGRVRNILAFLKGARGIPKALSGERFDAVIASSTYPYDNGVARRLAKRWGAAVVYEVHDLWPLSPMELGGYALWHPFIVATRLSEDAAYRGADLVVSLLPAAEPYMRSRGLAEGKFLHIPNGVDGAEWEASARAADAQAERRVEDFRAGRFLLCYAGAHGLANDLDTLVAAVASLDPMKIALVLVGKGPEKERLRTLAGDAGNILFLDPVDKAAIPSLLSRMDALYIGLQDQSLFRFGISPNKLIDYMMAARPVICAIRAGNDMVAEAGCGLTIPPGDPAAAARAIAAIAAMGAEERLALGERGLAYARARHDYRVLARDFSKALEAIVRSTSCGRCSSSS